MTEYTPRTIDVRGGYAASRLESNNIGWFYGFREFDRWLESHDAEVLHNATPAELIRAARDGSHLVPEGRVIPAGTPYMKSRKGSNETFFFGDGCAADMMPRSSDIEFRTLAPLPPLIPDGTPAVWASTTDCNVRRVLVLSDEPIGDIPRTWRDWDGDTYRDAYLINPVPIPKEGNR